MGQGTENVVGNLGMCRCGEFVEDLRVCRCRTFSEIFGGAQECVFSRVTQSAPMWDFVGRFY